jgi:hypothetical protein
MRFRRQTVADGALPAALRYIATRLAAAEIAPGLLRPFEALGALAVHPLFGAFWTITAVRAIATIHPFAAVRPVTPVEAVRAIRAILTVAPVIAAAVVLERTITVTIPVARSLLLMAVLAV